LYFLFLIELSDFVLTNFENHWILHFQIIQLFFRILNKVQETFQPEAVVCQCGADGLAGDPMESFNLTHKGLGKCVYFLLKWNLPTMILGGGRLYGFNIV